MIRLHDGRRLGYADYGEGDGAPVFAFHGTPGSRLMLRVADEPAKRLGIRLIAPDRPGFGLSNLQPGRTLVDWPDDLVQLADALGIRRFSVAGISGGGPYAAACAWKIAGRLDQVAIISGVGPVAGAELTPGLAWRHRALFGVSERAPRLTRRALRLGELAWKRAAGLAFGTVLAFAAPVDRPILRRESVRRALTDGIKEAFREGSAGLAHELALFARPWAFSLRQIEIPVRLWHGEADRLVPVAMGRHLAAAIPRCRAEFLPDAGHAWIFAHAEELLRALGAPDRA